MKILLQQPSCYFKTVPYSNNSFIHYLHHFYGIIFLGRGENNEMDKSKAKSKEGVELTVFLPEILGVWKLGVDSSKSPNMSDPVHMCLWSPSLKSLEIFLKSYLNQILNGWIAWDWMSGEEGLIRSLYHCDNYLKTVLNINSGIQHAHTCH